MKKLIVIRHGQFDNFGHLTPSGRDQINLLALNLKKIIGNETSINIISSPTDRTRESAEIIGQVFNTKIELSDYLLSDGFKHPMNLALATSLIKDKKNTGVLILVTHFDYASDLPIYYGVKELNVDFPSIDVKKGEGSVVNCEEKTLLLVK